MIQDGQRVEGEVSEWKGNYRKAWLRYITEQFALLKGREGGRERGREGGRERGRGRRGERLYLVATRGHVPCSVAGH